VALQQRLAAFFHEPELARREPSHGLDIDVEQLDVSPSLGEAQAERQTHVTATTDDRHGTRD
jgi:hypothetical protein